MKLTKDQIRAWLGDDEDEAVDVITEIANGDYSVESLQSDICETLEIEPDNKTKCAKCGTESEAKNLTMTGLCPKCEGKL